MSTEVEDEPLATVDIDHRPTKASSIAAVLAAVIASLTSAPFALLAAPLGFGGAVIIAAGLFTGDGNRAWVTIGAAGLFLSVLIAGTFGTPPELLLFSMAATILAWNFGQNAIGLGDQLGRHSKTRRNEIVHASVSVIVAIVVAGFGYVVFAAAAGGQPLAALGLMLLGAVILTWAIRN